MRKLFSWVTFALVAFGLTAMPALAAQEKKKADPEAQFKKMDANSDGKVTEEEFIGARKKADDAAKEKFKKQFAKLDTNNDKSLSLEEFKAGAKKAK